MTEGKLSQFDESSTPPRSSGQLSDFRAVSTISITAIGLGILALPGFISKFGPWLFFGALLLAGFSSWYMVVLFQRTLGMKRSLDGAPFESYAEVAEAALGPLGKALGVFVNHGSLLGICSCLMMLFGSVMDRICPLKTDAMVSIRWWVFAGTILAQPAVWIRSLKRLSVLGTAGVAAMFLLTILIVTTGLAEYDAFNIHAPATPPVPDAVAAPAAPAVDPAADEADDPARNHSVSLSGVDVVGLSTLFSNIVFAFGAIPIIPAVSRDLRVPGHFLRISLVSYLLIALLNGTVAGVGFLGWGTTLNSEGILAELQGPRDLKKGMSAVGWLASILALVVVFTHIIVLIRPVSDAMEKLGNKLVSPNHGAAVRSAVRMAMRSWPSLIMMTVGMFANNLEAAISFVASFTVMLLCVLLPPVFYLVLKAKTLKLDEYGQQQSTAGRLMRQEWKMLLCSTMPVICGTFGMVCGTYVAFQGLIGKK